MKLFYNNTIIIIFSMIALVCSAQKKQTSIKTFVKKDTTEAKTSTTKSCCIKAIPNRFEAKPSSNFSFNKQEEKSVSKNTEGMVWIFGGTFGMGGDNNQARQDEFPKHTVKIDGFNMDITEFTNTQFAKFVAATGYATTAEEHIDWEDLKKQLSPDTPKPETEDLKAASLVFVPTEHEVSLQDYSQWWSWSHGANWKRPKGIDSDVTVNDIQPVVYISWDNANAYCQWAGKRLQTEAELEFAARGDLVKNIYVCEMIVW